MESPVFGIQTKQNWKNIYGFAWATSVIFDNIERIVDQIQRNRYMTKLSDVLQEMPQTEALLSSFLRNLSPVILDIVDMITLRPIALVRKFCENTRLIRETLFRNNQINVRATDIAFLFVFRYRCSMTTRHASDFGHAL